MEDFTYYRNVKGFKEFEISFFPSTRKFRNAVRLFSRHGGGKGEKFSREGKRSRLARNKQKLPYPFEFSTTRFLAFNSL